VESLSAEFFRHRSHPFPEDIKIAKVLPTELILSGPIFLAFLAKYFPGGFRYGQPYVAVDANVYFLVEAIVDKVEAAGTNRAVG
jgi:hypothetical protein